MKQFNDITIIGIDQGYGNMKPANTIFRNKYIIQFVFVLINRV